MLFLSQIYTRRFCQPTQNLQNFKQKPSKNPAKICNQFTHCSNWRSHCIEAIFCLSLLGEFQKSADKVCVCKSGFTCNRSKIYKELLFKSHQKKQKTKRNRKSEYKISALLNVWEQWKQLNWKVKNNSFKTNLICPFQVQTAEILIWQIKVILIVCKSMTAHCPPANEHCEFKRRAKSSWYDSCFYFLVDFF